MDRVNEKQVMSQVFWRFVPFLMALYVLSYPDKVER